MFILEEGKSSRRNQRYRTKSSQTQDFRASGHLDHTARIGSRTTWPSHRIIGRHTAVLTRPGKPSSILLTSLTVCPSRIAAAAAPGAFLVELVYNSRVKRRRRQTHHLPQPPCLACLQNIYSCKVADNSVVAACACSHYSHPRSSAVRWDNAAESGASSQDAMGQ